MNDEFLLNKPYFDFFNNSCEHFDDSISIYENSLSTKKDSNTGINNNSELIHKRTMNEKKEKIKFLLSKRAASKEKKEEVNINDVILKKEKLKQKNREASQKSREKKKQQLIQLINENHKLKLELDNYNTKINQLCTHCKCMFEHTDICPINTSSQLYIDEESTASSYSESHSISFTIPATLCILLTILGCFFLITPDEQSNGNHPIMRRAEQINIRNYTSFEQYKEYKSVKSYPQILIDDNHDKKSYYMNIEDYYRLQNNKFEMCQSSTFYQSYKKTPKKETNNQTKTSSKKNYYNSVYFKMFVPLCNNATSSIDEQGGDENNLRSHYERYFLENVENEKDEFDKKDKDFYYEVECKVMNFSKLIKQLN